MTSNKAKIRSKKKGTANRARKVHGWSTMGGAAVDREKARVRVEESEAKEPEEGLFYDDEDEDEYEGDQVDAVVQLGSGDTSLHVDLDKLLKTRLLVVANSGGGKSYFLRQLAEKAARFTTVIVIDVEGEYASLRECSTLRDLLVVGDLEDRADVQIDSRVAGQLGAKLVEMNQSAVVDLSSLKKNTQYHYVADFLNAMIDLPKEMRSSAMIIIDEVHVFCPARGTPPSKAAISDLMSRGRKRGLCGVIATQRIAKAHNDTMAEATGRIIGRTVDKNDLERAADILELTKGGSRTLTALSPGEFWCMGGAFNEAFDKDGDPDSYKFKAGRPRSSHPEVGLSGRRRIRATRPSEATVAVIPLYEELEAGYDDGLGELGKPQLIERIRELQYQLDGIELECPKCGHDPEDTEGIPKYRNIVEIGSADDDEDLSGAEYEDTSEGDGDDDDDDLFIVPKARRAPIRVCEGCGQLEMQCTCDTTCEDCNELLGNCICGDDQDEEKPADTSDDAGDDDDEDFVEEPCDDCGAETLDACVCTCPTCDQIFLKCACPDEDED